MIFENTFTGRTRGRTMRAAVRTRSNKTERTRSNKTELARRERASDHIAQAALELESAEVLEDDRA